MTKRFFNSILEYKFNFKKYVYHISTQKKKKEKNPWIYGSSKNQNRKESIKKKKSEKKKENFCLKMLIQENRLRKKKDFDAVFKKGDGFKQGFLYLKIRKNNLGASRFGFVISKKFSKKAVIRNKTKRRLSEIIKAKLSEIKKGMDIIVVVMPGAENEFQELEDTLSKLFKKAKL